MTIKGDTRRKRSEKRHNRHLLHMIYAIFLQYKFDLTQANLSALFSSPLSIELQRYTFLLNEHRFSNTQ